MKKILLSISFTVVAACYVSFAQNPAKRFLNPSDVYRFQKLSDAQISPDGNWVAYTLETEILAGRNSPDMC